MHRNERFPVPAHAIAATLARPNYRIRRTVAFSDLRVEIEFQHVHRNFGYRDLLLVMGLGVLAETYFLFHHFSSPSRAFNVSQVKRASGRNLRVIFTNVLAGTFRKSLHVFW